MDIVQYINRDNYPKITVIPYKIMFFFLFFKGKFYSFSSKNRGIH